MNDDMTHLALFMEPVRKYLEDETVSEILINGPNQIYIERKGKLEKTDVKFVSEPALKATAVNIGKSAGRLLNEENPRLDARLPDGSRVHAVIPPLCKQGTAIAIRKFSKDTITAKELRDFGSVDDDGLKLIEAIVGTHQNTIVSGATSSGKTSVLNVLSGFISEEERILVLEDTNELQLQQPHVVYFEARPPDKNGKGEVTIRDLLHSTLRLRPDRLIIGEIRGGEALDLLQALNTGHAGSMSTIHANSALDALSRLETCAMLAGMNMPLQAIRNQVASAVDVIVQTSRLPDGSRKLVSICEVMPLAGNEYTVSEVYKWVTSDVNDEGGIEGHFTGCGRLPSFLGQAEIMGMKVPATIFEERR